MKKSRSSKSKNKKVLLGILFVVVIGVIVSYASSSQDNTSEPKSKLLGPWMDVHGVCMFLF